jgi:hypothetical protein
MRRPDWTSEAPDPFRAGVNRLGRSLALHRGGGVLVASPLGVSAGKLDLVRVASRFPVFQ